MTDKMADKIISSLILMSIILPILFIVLPPLIGIPSHGINQAVYILVSIPYFAISVLIAMQVKNRMSKMGEPAPHAVAYVTLALFIDIILLRLFVVEGDVNGNNDSIYTHLSGQNVLETSQFLSEVFFYIFILLILSLLIVSNHYIKTGVSPKIR